MLSFLPTRILNAVKHVNFHSLYELRLRADKPIFCNINSVFEYLGESGIVKSPTASIFPTTQEVEQTLFAACNYSIYSVENEIRQGFVTTPYGVRLGIAGTYVYEGNSVLTIRSVTSLCIRVPHEIIGCSEEIYERCLKEQLCSLLILSPPGYGKTTLLRDLARLIGERTMANVLISDERGEIEAGDVGLKSDCIRYADKNHAFTAGIRGMRPDVIITDELLEEDYKIVKRAMEGGVKVIASAHLTKYKDVPYKIFEKYVIVDGLGKIGKIMQEEQDELD